MRVRPWIWLVLTPLTAWIPFLAWGRQARRPAWIALSAVYVCVLAGAVVTNVIAGDEGSLGEAAGVLLLGAWGTGALSALLLWFPFAAVVVALGGGVQCIALGLGLEQPALVAVGGVLCVAAALLYRTRTRGGPT